MVSSTSSLDAANFLSIISPPGTTSLEETSQIEFEENDNNDYPTNMNNETGFMADDRNKFDVEKGECEIGQDTGHGRPGTSPQSDLVPSLQDTKGSHPIIDDMEKDDNEKSNKNSDDSSDNLELMRLLRPYSYVPAWDSKFEQYHVQVNPAEGDRAVDIPLYSMARPHMRAFHLSWMSFLVAFFAWFAMTPLLSEIRDSLDLTKEEIWISSAVAVTSSAVTRCLIGPLNDTYGARWIMCGTLVASAIPTALSGWLIQGAMSLYIVRFWIGIAGSSFVTCQYWTSSMFATEIAGTANALVAGWGNLGGGLAQIIMGSMLFPVAKLAYGRCDNDSSDVNEDQDEDDSEYVRSSDLAWRTVMIFPAILSFAMAFICVKYGDDTPKGNVSDLNRYRKEKCLEKQQDTDVRKDVSKREHSFIESKQNLSDHDNEQIDNATIKEHAGERQDGKPSVDTQELDNLSVQQDQIQQIDQCSTLHRDEIHETDHRSQLLEDAGCSIASENRDSLEQKRRFPQAIDAPQDCHHEAQSSQVLLASPQKAILQILPQICSDTPGEESGVTQNKSQRENESPPCLEILPPKTSVWSSIGKSFKQGASNMNTWLLFLQYGCCFGVEITVTQAAALYFQEEFGQSTASAAALASVFGWMNLFARGLGGFLSDLANSKAGLRGRLWCQVILLLMEGALVVAFSFSGTLGGAISVMIMFSIFVKAAEGSTFGIVPYVDGNVTGSVTGIVGAGGNVGGVLFALLFAVYDYQPGFVLMGCASAASAVLSAFISIPGYKGLLTGQDAEAIAFHRRQAKLPTIIIFETQPETNRRQANLPSFIVFETQPETRIEPDTAEFHDGSDSSSRSGIHLSERDPENNDRSTDSKPLE